jgi:hypothetical protein
MAEETPTFTNLRPDATIGIQPYILRQEDVDKIIKTEATKGEKGDAPRALATDLVNVFSASDFKEEIQQDPNFLSYELLRSGKAKILDYIPAYAGKKPVDRQLTDQDINILFSNAKEADFARPFFTELAKSAPATYAGVKTAGIVGSRLIPAAAVSPVAPIAVPAAFLATGAASIASAGITYFAGEKIEDAFLGPKDPITPTSKAAHEAYRTLGAFTGSIFAPWMFKDTVDLGYNAAVSKLAEGASPAFQTRMLKVFEDMISGTGTLAKKSPLPLAGAELTSGAGASLGAYYSESMFPGSIGPRLFSEFLGANTFYSTFLRVVPNALKNLQKTDVTGAIVDKSQEKLFTKINETYKLYGTDEGYDQLIRNLTDENFIKELEDAFPGVKFTAAQQSGDPLIMAIESVKAKQNQTLDSTRKQNATKAEAFLLGLTKALEDKGDDQSLKAAAEIRESMFSNTLQMSYEEKLENFLKAAEKLKAQPGQTGSKSKADISVQMFSLLEDTLNSVKKKESDFWDKVGSVPLIQPIGPNAKSDDLPNFLKTWNKILPKDAAVRQDFEKKVKVLTDFIANAREDLGLKPLVNFTKEEQKTINKFQKTAENFQIKLAGFEEESALKQALREAKGLDDDAKVDFFRTYAYRNLGLTGDEATKGERMLLSALNAYGDLSASKVTATQRATTRAQSPLVDAQAISAARLVEVRSTALSLARGFAADPSTAHLAKRVGKFAEALLDDLDVDGFGDAYNTARAFSRAKNDVYTRAILGKAFQKDKAGGEVLPAEVTFELFVKRNPSLTLNRLRQLNTLSEFLDEQDIKVSETLRRDTDFVEMDDDEPIFTTMNKLTDNFLRRMEETVGREVFDPETGNMTLVLDANKLEKFKKDNAQVLEQLPGLIIDLDNVVSAKNTLESFKFGRKKVLEEHKKQTILSSLLNGASPTVALAEAVNGSNPVKSLNQYFSLSTAPKETAQKVGISLPQFKPFNAAGRKAKNVADADLNLEDINDGFKRSIIQHALMKSGGEGDFDIESFAKVLYGPLKKDPNYSLMDIVKTYDIFSKTEFDRIRLMTSQLLKIKAAEKAGNINDPDFVEKAGPLLGFYFGIGGSALGTKTYQTLTGGAGGPGSITAAGIGKNAVTDFLLKIPQVKNLEKISTIFLDPKTVAQLLKKPKTERDKKRVTDTIIENLSKTFGNIARQGIPISVPKVGEAITPEGDAERERFLLKQRQLEEMKKKGAPMIPPREGPINQNTAPVNQNQIPPNESLINVNLSPPVQNQKVDRRRFAALFPEDADLIQGIGSLRA